MIDKRRRAVLVSAPGLVQQATESVLAACAELDVVATTPGALSATRALKERRPDLLLIDATLAEEEVEELLGWARAHCPDVECVAMTVTSRQSDQALSWGASATIHRSDLTDQLAKLLRCTGERKSRS